MKTKYFILTTFILIFSSSLFAQNTFFKSFLLPETTDQGWKVIAEEDGFSFLSASTCYTDTSFFSCPHIIKTDLVGEILWLNSLKGSPQATGSFYALTKLNDNGYIVNGSVSPDYSTKFQARMLKLDAMGDTLWSTVYGDTLNTYIARATYELESGNTLTLGGHVPAGEETAIYHITKYSPSGEQLFFKNIDVGCFSKFGLNLIPTEDENLMFAFICWGDPIEEHLPGVVKIDTSGNVLWINKLDDWQRDCDGNSPVALLPNGGYAITNCFPNPNELQPWPKSEAYIKGFNADHEIIWETILEGTSLAWYMNIWVWNTMTAANGDIIIIGEHMGDLPNVKNMGYLSRVSPDGELLWRRFYIMEDKEWDYPYFLDIDETSDGRIVMTGSTSDKDDNGESNRNVLMVVVDENGCLNPDCGSYVYLSHLTPTNDLVTDYQEVFFHLSPNPATPQTKLNFYNPIKGNDSRIKIFDLTGRLLFQEKIAVGIQDIEIDLSDFSAGLYLVVYEQDGRILQKERLVKQ